MKTILKYIAGLIVGIVGGLMIGGLISVMFTDTSLVEYIDRLRSGIGLDAVAAASVGVAAFIVSLLILIPAHEAGHLVCGLLSGYKFVSFRIFNYTFIRAGGKIRIKKFAVDGTGGQCLLTPPELPDSQIPTALYNAGGVIANIVLLLAIVPLFRLGLNPFVKESLAVFCLCAVLLILINGVPMKLAGVGNDAYNILLLRKSPLSKHAFVVQLRSNALIQNGVRPKDMPDEWTEWLTDIDYHNPLEVSIPLMHASRAIDEMDFERAFIEFDTLYGHKDDMIQLYVNEIACELAFCAMAIGRTDRAEELLDVKLRRYIDTYSRVMSSKRRIQCAIALWLDHDPDEALRIYESLRNSKDSYLLQGEVESDLAIMAHMLDRAPEYYYPHELT